MFDRADVIISLLSSSVSVPRCTLGNRTRRRLMLDKLAVKPISAIENATGGLLYFIALREARYCDQYTTRRL